ncbi:MAG TPA: glycosyltransferase family 4 protein, partial [Tepidisphaeraceae bacterium]|nr:glycosyltransferase family 4 protein [Tepidisphaeraceae bacterium]
RQSTCPNPQSKLMNVALVYHNFAHYRSAILMELWKKGRHRYTFVSDLTDHHNPSIKPWELPRDLPHKRLHTRRFLKKLWWHSGVVSMARSKDFDALILLGNANWPAFWLAAIFGRLSGKRVYFWTHGWTHRDGRITGFIRKTFYSLAHGMMVYGHFGKMLSIDRGLDPLRIHVIYNSLDYAEQIKTRASVTEADLIETRRSIFNDIDTPIAICSTRLTQQRRLDILFEAVSRLRLRNQKINVLLVGDGPERANLEALAKQLEINVHFFGACYDETTLARLTMAANVTVAPGQVGLTAMQSLAYGTPVITHDDYLAQMPEFESIVDGETGSLVKRDDVDSLTHALELWTRSRFVDESVRNNCHAVIDRFWNPVIQRILIERALEGEVADDLYNGRCAELNNVKWK